MCGTTMILTLQDAWYYDELDMQEMEGFDDPDPDSDYDYEESYSKRKGKKRTSKVTRNTDSPAAKKPKVNCYFYNVFTDLPSCMQHCSMLFLKS
jgi:hypothetical protein